MNHPSYCCQKCGERIGWLGRFFQFIHLPTHVCDPGNGCPRIITGEVVDQRGNVISRFRRIIPIIVIAILFTGCAYTRVELANKVHGTTLITSANIVELDVKLTPTSAIIRARSVNHSVPTKEIGNNIGKAGTAAVGLLGAGVTGL